MCGFFIENWETLIITIIGSFLGFGSALWIENRSRMKNERDKQKEVENENGNKIKYYRLLLDKQIDYFRKQILEVENYIKNHRGNTFTTPLSPILKIASNNMSRLKSIDSRGIFEALSKKFSNDPEFIDKYMEINEKIDFFEFVEEDLFRIHNIVMDEYTNTEKLVKDEVDAIPKILSTQCLEIVDKFKDKAPLNKEYIFLVKYLNLYRAVTEKRTFSFAYDKALLEPMLKEILEMPVEMRGNEYVIKLIFHLKQARLLLYEQQESLEKTFNEYEDNYIKFKDHLDNIQEFADTLK